MRQLHQLHNRFLEQPNTGPRLIVAGMSVVLLAMLWPGLPIAAAVMLIGCGAMNTLFSRPGRQELLGMLSLAVYASLGCLAVAAQTHAAINSPAASVSVLLQIDHAAATVLLAIMIRATIRRLRSPAH